MESARILMLNDKMLNQSESTTKGNSVTPPTAFEETTDLQTENSGQDLGPAVKKNPFADIKKLRARNRELIEGSNDIFSVTIGPPPKD
jgi:hypothetical protein